MEFPAFFAAAPTIALRDPLARFLGAAANGILEYRYADAVKLAGHSSPTVASTPRNPRPTVDHRAPPHVE